MGEAGGRALTAMHLSSRWRRGCGRVVILALLLAVVIVVHAVLTAPDVGALAKQNPPTTAFIERARQRAQRNRGPAVQWTWVSGTRISPDLARAVVAGEDLAFFQHRGFDVHEIRRALADAWVQREWPRGASTITQQVAKNLWLSPSYDPVRKLREAVLTRRLERALSKRRILEIYLNVAEFGPGVYGAEAAARRYFDKSAADLDAHEAAQLAACLPRPATWHPGSASRAYARRVRILEGRAARAWFPARML